MSINQQTIDRHKYTDFLVGLSVDIYVGCQCGLRTTSRIIQYLNNRLKWELKDTPSMGSIKNWVEKSGYSIYKEPPIKYNDKDYAMITDESMMIGSEKMLLTIGIKANKETQSALSFQDIDVLDISVRHSWNAEKIAEVLSKIEGNVNKPPLYVISDNASTISKSIRIQGHAHIQDVGHTLAMFIERKYKHYAPFKAYIKDLSMVKFKENMKLTSYLLPPKQRGMARFMNLTPCIQWSMKILKSFNMLSEIEKNVFSFLKTHHKIINELYEIAQAFNEVSKELKNNGLSYKTIRKCQGMINPLFTSKHKGVIEVAENFMKYMGELQNKLPNKNANWHVSSDIIESLFGHYKNRKSKNPLDGVTRQVLFLPLLTKIDSKTGRSDICFKKSLEQNLLSDLKQWSNDKLTENLAVKRRKVLNAA